MEQASELFIVLAGVALGLSAGALLAQGAILVPIWRELPPGEFLAWYKRNGARLQHFFAPLMVITALIAIAAAVLTYLSGDSEDALQLAAAALLFLCGLAEFPLYFRRANESFTTGTIEPSRVPSELARWSTWHWSRTCLAIAATVIAVIAA